MGSPIKQSVPKLPLKAPVLPVLKAHLYFCIKSQWLTHQPLSPAHRTAVGRFSLGTGMGAGAPTSALTPCVPPSFQTAKAQSQQTGSGRAPRGIVTPPLLCQRDTCCLDCTLCLFSVPGSLCLFATSRLVAVPPQRGQRSVTGQKQTWKRGYCWSQRGAGPSGTCPWFRMSPPSGYLQGEDLRTQLPPPSVPAWSIP